MALPDDLNMTDVQVIRLCRKLDSGNDRLRGAINKFLEGRMKNFTDSRAVDDDLVELAAAVSDS